MKARFLFLTVVAAIFLAAGCTEQEPDYGLPELEASVTALSYDQSSSTQTFTLRSTRDWAIRSYPGWIKEISPSHGPASLENQEIRITVDDNGSYDREGEIIFTIGFIKVPVAVTQKGPSGPMSAGSGTLEDPYTVAGALAFVRALEKDVATTEDIYIKGKICAVGEAYTSNYGNGTFYISDDGSDQEDSRFYVYRALYLGNKRFADGDTQIQVGDEVIICGKVVNYRGNTPETVINQAFLHTLNGTTEGGGGTGGGGGGGGGNSGDAVFFNNFDKAAATQTYGSSGNSWPFLDQFEGWKNESGSGAANVRYEFSNLSARNNSSSSGNYSDYSGSGTNNLLFGAAGNYFKIGNITLSGTDFSLSFGTEKYVNSGNSTFSHSEFHVYASNDGEKWVELSYSFPNGDKSGRWDLASTSFSVPSGTGVLYLYFKADVASAYRLDDVRLETASTSGTVLDFSKGITLEGGGTAGGGGGGGGGGNVTPTDLATIIAATDGTAVSAENVYVGAVTTKGFVATDGKSHIYVYQNATPSVAVGDIVQFTGSKTTYYGMPEIENPTVSKTSSGTVPYPTPKDVTASFASYTNTVAEYITFTATIVKSGNYTNFQVDGVSGRVGSLSSAPTAMYTGLTAGEKVVVTGYFNGIHTTSNLLQVIATKIEIKTSASGYGAKVATAKWMELPQTAENDKLEWFHHYATLGSQRVRNFSYDWSYGDRVALWVAYPLYNSIMGSGSRSEAWGYDPSMPASVQQNVSKAYTAGNNGRYDRGHQLPSADRLGSQEINSTTFYGTNMTPQNNSFNTGVWSNLESKVRGWSTNSDTLYVVTGCVVDGAQYYVYDASDHQVTVPTAYFKAILRYRKPTGSETLGYQGYMGIGFYYEHTSYSSGAVQKTQALSLAALEEKLGYKLFVNLASAVGNDIATQIKSENPANVNWWW